MLRDVLRRVLGWPARRVLDRRVEWTHNLIDERFGHEPGRPHLHHRLDVIDDRLDTLVRFAGARRAGLSGAAGADLTLQDLTADLAAFLNWSEGPAGFAGQAGVWFNPPVPAEYVPGGVRPLHVTERIVEQPFAFVALGTLAPGSRILDVGGSESHVGLALAATGFDVTLVDPRGTPLRHPNLTVHACRLDELEQRGFDAALALSAIEHFGLGHYAGGGTGDDRAAMADLRARLRPGGMLVLTVPYGEASVDGFQRVYDAAGLAALLDGWTVERIRYGARPHWTLQDAPAAGVALVVARR